MTVDEFDAPRLTKAPTAHCISMLSGASIQYCVYAVPAYYTAKVAPAEFPYYLALINNKDNSVITSIGMRDYTWAMTRAFSLCMENLGKKVRVV